MQEALAHFASRPEPTTWLFVGDSITHGVWHTRGARSYPEHIQEVLRSGRWRIHDLFINQGVSGTTVPETLDDWQLRVTRHQADVAFVMLGTNDASTSRDVTVADFEQGLAEACRRLTGQGTVPILMTPPGIVAPADPSRSRITEYVDAVRRVAAAQDCGLIDHHAHWGNGGEICWGWLDDAIHPNAAGHAVIAALMLDAMSVVRAVAWARSAGRWVSASKPERVGLPRGNEPTAAEVDHVGRCTLAWGVQWQTGPPSDIGIPDAHGVGDTAGVGADAARGCLA